MKNLCLTVMAVTIWVYAFMAHSQAAPAAVVAPAAAVVAPVAAAVVSAAPAASSFLSAGFIALVISIVACLNIALSAVQQMFSSLSKSEPGWLQSVSSVVLAVAKFLGSNPSV
jgi:hypothetical protein